MMGLNGDYYDDDEDDGDDYGGLEGVIRSRITMKMALMKHVIMSASKHLHLNDTITCFYLLNKSLT